MTHFSTIGACSRVWIMDGEEPYVDAAIRVTGAPVVRSAGDPPAEFVQIHRWAGGLADVRGIDPDQLAHPTRSIVLSGDR